MINLVTLAKGGTTSSALNARVLEKSGRKPLRGFLKVTEIFKGSEMKKRKAVYVMFAAVCLVVVALPVTIALLAFNETALETIQSIVTFLYFPLIFVAFAIPLVLAFKEIKAYWNKRPENRIIVVSVASVSAILLALFLLSFEICLNCGIYTKEYLTFNHTFSERCPRCLFRFLEN